MWPRPWDPSQPIDFSGVSGVTNRQEGRAERLAARTLDVLPAKFADVKTLPALGFHSIGDASTGFEHYINIGYIGDDHFLDPNYPESLVYRVDGEQRDLVSAMYIAKDRPIDDPKLVRYGGPLMQWHVHLNLCWAINDQGVPTVVAVTDDHGGTCPAGSVNAGGNNPMVHVWVAPHECGPFAALEGHGAGQADAADGSTHRPVRRRARPWWTVRHRGGRGAGALRPAEAHRPQWRRRRHAAPAGLRREPRRDERGPPTPMVRPSRCGGRRLPLDRRRRHRARALHPVGLDQRRRVARSGRTRRASSTSRSPTAPRNWCRRCTCSPTTSRSTRCPTTAAS